MENNKKQQPQPQISAMTRGVAPFIEKGLGRDYRAETQGMRQTLFAICKPQFNYSPPRKRIKIFMKSKAWENRIMYKLLLCFITLFVFITEPFADKYVKDFAVWRYFLIESTNALTGKKGFELWQVSFIWSEDENKNPSRIEFEVVDTEIHKRNN